MTTSYYAEGEQEVDDVEEQKEQICSRCRGLGTDAQGADCLACEGYGSIVLRF